MSMSVGQRYGEKYELIANMQSQDILESEILLVVGCAAEQFAEIQLDPDYVAMRAQVAQEKFNAIQNKNEGWDAVEERALENILTNLTWMKNPDYALKVAAVANRANRRTKSNHNVTLSPEALGARIVINLNQQFVDRIQAMAPARMAQRIDAKQTDVLPPQKVEQLLGEPQVTLPEVHEYLKGVR